jgi:S-adenosylmethionine:tRNA ribosyltransferase-isomerase
MSTNQITSPLLDSSFRIPPELNASEPPEARGVSRSDVKLLVLNKATGEVHHSIFEKLAEYLHPGDLLVFNSSRTLPASLLGRDTRTGNKIEVRLAQHLPDDSWLALLLCERCEPIECLLAPGIEIEFSSGLTCLVQKRDPRIPLQWHIRFSLSGARLINSIYRIGKPIRYEHVPLPWSINHYQNVYAREPGAAEMPSAGRAFTWKLLFDLKKTGVEFTDIVLHTGLSSYMDDEWDAKHLIPEEEFLVRADAAARINGALDRGNRIIAVGTTVVRALESIASAGRILPGTGYTRLRITPQHQLQAVHGLLTGLHEPQASHFDLLQAFTSKERILPAYWEAITRGYLWHEFGDLNLIL